MQIVSLGEALIDPTNQHLRRHLQEDGKYGIHWLPYDPSTISNPPAVNIRGLTLNHDQPGWERWWVLQESPDRVIGHLSLKGARFDRGLHRCELGMGLEKPCWRQGYGSSLLKTCIEAAGVLPGVEWLDLRVLSLNGPGISLYEKFGFKEISRIPDFCRINGQPADDILMSLDVSVPG